MAGGRVRGGISRGISRGNGPDSLHDVLEQSLSASVSGHPRGGESTHTAHKPHLSSCNSSFLSQQYCSSQDFNICFLALCSSGVCFDVARTDIIGFCWCSVVAVRIATAVFGRKSLNVHTTFLHCAHQALCGFAVTKDIHLSQMLTKTM